VTINLETVFRTSGDVQAAAGIDRMSTSIGRMGDSYQKLRANVQKGAGIGAAVLAAGAAVQQSSPLDIAREVGGMVVNQLGYSLSAMIHPFIGPVVYGVVMQTIGPIMDNMKKLVLNTLGGGTQNFAINPTDQEYIRLAGSTEKGIDAYFNEQLNGMSIWDLGNARQEWEVLRAEIQRVRSDMQVQAERIAVQGRYINTKAREDARR
jgi:hypothetical protein